MNKGILFLILFIFSYSVFAVELICKSEIRWGNATGNKVLDDLNLCLKSECIPENKDFSITIKGNEILDVTSWSRDYKTTPVNIKFTHSQVRFDLPSISFKSKDYTNISIDRVSGTFYVQEWYPHMKPYIMGDTWRGECKPFIRIF